MEEKGGRCGCVDGDYVILPFYWSFLSSYSLHNNSIGDEGAKGIGNALGASTMLHTLECEEPEPVK